MRFLRSRKKKMKAARRRTLSGTTMPTPRAVGETPVFIVDAAAAAAAEEVVVVGLEDVEDGGDVDVELDVELEDELELVDVTPVTLVTATEYAARVKFFCPQSEVAPLHTKRPDPFGTPGDLMYGFWHQDMIWKLLRLGDPKSIVRIENREWERGFGESTYLRAFGLSSCILVDRPSLSMFYLYRLRDRRTIVSSGIVHLPYNCHHMRSKNFVLPMDRMLAS